jgi:hypothetical protein
MAVTAGSAVQAAGLLAALDRWYAIDDRELV